MFTQHMASNARRLLSRSLIAIVLLGLSACSSLPKIGGEKPIDRARQFFEVYQQRSDFEALMSFYAEDAQFEDLIYGHFAGNKSAIRSFLNWNDGKFSLAPGRLALKVDSLIEQDNLVVARGHFSEFSYNNQSFGPWRFVILLEFNDSGYIVRETDWINYTPRNKFLNGEDLNNRLPRQ